MKIDLNQVLRNPWGVAILDRPAVIDKDGKETEPAVEATLGSVCAGAFLRQHESDRGGKPEDITRTYRLVQTFVAGGAVEISVEDLAFTRARVAQVWPLMIAGPALALLDAPAAADKPKGSKAA